LIVTDLERQRFLKALVAYLTTRGGLVPSEYLTRFLYRVVMLSDGGRPSSLRVRKPYESLAIALSDYVSWHINTDDATKAAERLAGQEAWSLTQLAAAQRRLTEVAIEEGLRRGSIRLAETITAVDLGCGDGQATVAFIRSISGFTVVRKMYLVDHSGSAVAHARRRILDMKSGAPTSVEGLVCGVEDPTLWAAVHSDECVVVFASAALHEVQGHTKQRILMDAGKHADVFILVELLSDHETPATGSRALVLRSAAFYESLIADAYASKLPKRTKDQVIGAFLLGELLDIWAMPIERRVNYHRSMHGWSTLMKRAGFHSASLTKISVGSGALRMGCIVARNTSRYG
jgi:trans-aconitate methyltransferase